MEMFFFILIMNLKNSTRYQLILLTFVGQTLLTTAAPVDPATAFTEAQSFLAGKGITLSKHPAEVKSPRYDGSQTGTADYYVFNADNDKGFVVVSGDDRTPKILGYGLSGSLDASRLPHSIKSWLQGYCDEIRYLDSMNVTTAKAKAYMKSSAKSSTVRKPIAPLLITRWNQDEPYWNSCPVFNGLRGYTGCVATAMAQVLYHHRDRSVKATIREIPAYEYRFNSTFYYTERKVPAGTPIDWDNMLPDYSKVQATAEQKKAVADFMHLCGDAVKMMYSPFASGAYDQEVAKAMVNYFGYDSSTAFLQRADYTMEAWNRIIYNELSNNRPVVYGGMSAASTAGGHCFVIDGYDGDEYFHVNWGWGGMGDGYFLLTSLLPDEVGIGAGEVAGGYQYYQDAIINARPSVGGDYADIPLYVSGLSLLKDGKIATGFGNAGLYENKFTIGFGSIDNDGNVTPLATTDCKIGTSYVEEVLYRDTFDLKSHLTVPGTYRIVPISHNSNNTRWNICWDNYDRHYIKAVVADDGSITMTTLQPVFDLECEKLRVGGTLSAIQGHSLTATIRNKGISFDGHIHFIIYSEGHRLYQDSVYVGIQQGGTETMSVVFLPVDTGSYTATVCSDIEGKNVLRSVNFKIVDVEKYDNSNAFLVSNITLRGLSENNPRRHEGAMLFTIYGDSISGGITLHARKSMDKATPLIVLQKKTGNIWTPVDSTEQAMENIREDKTYFRDFNFTHLDPGIYKFTIKYQHWSDSTFTWITDWAGDFDHYQLGSGVTQYKARSHEEQMFTGSYTIPDDILAADLRGCKSADIRPNSNPNTIYIVSENDKAATLAGKNVVVCNPDGSFTAQAIHISDSHSFYTPVSFTARTASYTRTFSEGGTWTTLQLPFAPTRATAGSTVRPIGGTQGNALNIYEFSGNNDRQAVFSPTNENSMEADLPYILRTDNVRGQTVSFTASNAAFTASPNRSGVRSENYKFTGTLAADTLYNVFTLSADGTQFDFQSKLVSRPFRACFFGYGEVADTENAVFRPIVISAGTVSTGISSVATKAAPDVIYDLKGFRHDKLQRGLNIVGGRKIFVK